MNGRILLSGTRMVLTTSLMETFGASISEARDAATANSNGENEIEGFKQRVDEIISKLEQKVHDIENFYSSMNKNQTSTPKVLRSNSRMPLVEKRLLQKECKILCITQHKWAWPFMQPVDIEGLGLHDYYEVIDKPMDFSTIKNQMEAKDGTGYKHVREICADVRLVFKNAMKYNDERSDVHVMAKTLLSKFEEKWLQLLPKVTEEETRREEEEAEAQLALQVAQEAAQAKMARDLSNELYEVDVILEELREMVVKRFRKMSTEEKRKLGDALTRLSPEDLSKALEIVAQNNPSFQATAEEVDLDMDAQSESTLWRLKFFVKEALEVQGKNSGSMGGNENQNNKRKRELCDAIAKTKKKTKKHT
ncbi:Transcription factor GTE1 [Glycine soja]